MNTPIVDDETKKRLQKERRIYLLKMLTSSYSPEESDLEKYSFNHVFVFFGFPVCSYNRLKRKIKIWQIVIYERLKGHKVHISSIFLAGK